MKSLKTLAKMQINQSEKETIANQKKLKRFIIRRLFSLKAVLQ